MSFLQIWERIKESTNIKKLNELAEIVETTQPYISRIKKKDQFPVEWAYKVGQRYNILTEWILTGQRPKSLQKNVNEPSNTFIFLNEVNIWLDEIIIQNPKKKDWFEVQFEDKFPMFKEWRKRREEEESSGDSSESKKIA